MKLNESSSAQLKATIHKALSSYTADGQNFVTDIHLQTSPVSGECKLFDDDDMELGRTTVKEWVAYEGDDFDEQVEEVLTAILHEMKDSGSFDQLQIMKPYSFVHIDEDKETIAELLLMDDDTMIITDGLLKGLDEELNEFLKDLLSR